MTVATRLFGCVVLVACGAPVERTTPITNIQPPPRVVPDTPCSPQWLDEAERIEITEIASGHFGLWELHVVLRRDADLRHPDHFIGQAIGVYRRWYGEAPHTEIRPLELPVGDVAATLRAMRDAIAMPEPANAGRHLVVDDSSRSLAITIDVLAAAPERGLPRHVQFFSDAGHSEPQLWRIRDCARDVTFASRRPATQAYARLARMWKGDAIYDAAYARSQKP
ncbi:MAG TPA: hypothetical protein VFQ53_23335 [Kofleriaceae bacterium]|nr:hypothetical protein [Kofleriaceae bacterium]